MLGINEVQIALRKLGYYDGALDGDPLGENFRDDLRRFQRDYPATGQVDGWFGPRTNKVLEPLYDKLRRQAPAQVASMRRWLLTHYYVGDVRAHGLGEAVPIWKATGGSWMVRVTPEAFVEAALNGSTRLKDGRLVNVSGWRPVSRTEAVPYQPVLEIARRNKWLPNKPGYAGLRLDSEGRVHSVRTFDVRDPGPKGWPIGARNLECDPFRTVAADNGRLPRHDPAFRQLGGVVPAGTRVFILELAGLPLPDRTTHDGWVTVNDTGGGIFGAHFDVFAGTRALAKKRRLPDLAHIWFEGIEKRLPVDYSYGLR